jgi:hypothetical protein
VLIVTRTCPYPCRLTFICKCQSILEDPFQMAPALRSLPEFHHTELLSSWDQSSLVEGPKPGFWKLLRAEIIVCICKNTRAEQMPKKYWTLERHSVTHKDPYKEEWTFSLASWSGHPWVASSGHDASNAGTQAIQLPVWNPGKEEMLSFFAGISGTHQAKSAYNNSTKRTR